jgi:hypothetical protein
VFLFRGKFCEEPKVVSYIIHKKDAANMAIIQSKTFSHIWLQTSKELLNLLMNPLNIFLVTFLEISAAFWPLP